MPPHELSVTIYLEDTDAQGIVYHSNYLKYCERARTEVLRQRSTRSLGEWQQAGFLFVVHELHVKYKMPARLHDTLVVRTELERGSPFRLTFKHHVERPSDGAQVVHIVAGVVAVSPDGGLRELPPDLLG